MAVNVSVQYNGCLLPTLYKCQTGTTLFWEATVKSSEEESWFGVYIVYRAQMSGKWIIMLEP